MDLSIITPVYNTKKEYLDEYYDSIIQNCSSISFEIIIVDGGSTLDETKIWLSEHEGSENLLIINLPENKGISVTRNTALDVAKGEYILILDSDDYISSESICTVLKNAQEKNIDMYFTTYSVQRESKIENITFRTKQDISYYQLESIPTSSRIITRNLINEYNIRYPIGKLCEDPCFNFCCFLHAKRFFVSDEAFLTIRSHADSTCHTKSVFHSMRYDQIPFEYIRKKLCVDFDDADNNLKDVHK